MQTPFEKWHARAPVIIVIVLTAILHTAAFPFAFVGGQLWCVPECGYLFLLPLAVWLMRPRKTSHVVLVAGGAFWLSWAVLLWWLRHVTFGGTMGLSWLMAVFPLFWALVARRVMPGLDRRGAGERFAILCGLAGLWAFLEWVRTWFLYGFPWLPLAASQWNRPAMLQILPVTGWLGLSWVMAFFNLALASYAMFLTHAMPGAAWWRRLVPELYAALFLVAGCAMCAMSVVFSRAPGEELFSAGLVQPYVPGVLKWDENLAQANLATLDRQSTFAAAQGAQVVFWPESATPWPVMSPNPTMSQWTAQICSNIALPIVMGNMAEIEGEGGDFVYYNGVFVVDPTSGLSDVFYAKRKLVPFGEFNPFEGLMRNFVKHHMDYFTPGRSATIQTVTVPGGPTYRLGSLLCYEDIFPALARSEAREGVDFFFVATNNAWYGEEAGAYQHAVHSILRAVENRRPVLRCGNGGWSGMIDEYGVVRSVCTRPGKGVYFEGEDVVPLLRDPLWKDRLTFYTRHGDWFAYAAAAMVLGMWIVVRRTPAPTPPPAKPDGIPVAKNSDKPRRSRRIGDL
jgi:apolipoprotein N-acyltransferase